jgi:AcrR family transcriptional regulator
MSTNRDLPIWLRPEPSSRQPGLSRERIAATALAIADAEGFEAVSMRRIATELGCGTMSLYHYVRTKDDVVELMDDALMGQMVLDEIPRNWRQALHAIARRTHDVFVRHPWALVSLRGVIPGPNGMRHFEQCLAALSRTKLSSAQKLELLALVDDFVFGYTLRAAETRGQKVSAKVRAAVVAFGKRQLETGAFPHTAALFSTPDDENLIERLVSDDGRFERGLEAILASAP